MRTFIIAEAGVNHDGDLDLALRLVDAARDCGADAVKFQTFQTDLLVTAAAPKASYQVKSTGGGESQADMVRKLELGPEAFRRIAQHCAEIGIQFLSTPFDVPSVGLLQQLGVPLLKIPSGEITNPFLLEAVARTGLPVLVSTGMATLSDVESALGVLAMTYRGETYVGGDATAALARPGAWDLLKEKVTLFHCTTEYPCPPGEVNLRAMDTLAHAFGLAVGYSDHTDGIAVPIAAVARGATVIEKHFTLDRTRQGPDHAASLDPAGFAAMVLGIREVEQALGHGRKIPTASELPNRRVARRSLVAVRPIAQGQVISREDLDARRPGGVISPMDLGWVVGRTAERDVAAGEAITFGGPHGG